MNKQLSKFSQKELHLLETGLWTCSCGTPNFLSTPCCQKCHTPLPDHIRKHVYNSMLKEYRKDTAEKILEFFLGICIALWTCVRKICEFLFGLVADILLFVIELVRRFPKTSICVILILIYFLVPNINDGFRDSKFIEMIAAPVKSFFGWCRNLWEPIGDWFSGLWDHFCLWFTSQDFGELLADLRENTSRWLGAAWENIREWSAALWEFTKAVASDIRDWFVEQDFGTRLAALWDKISQLWGTASEKEIPYLEVPPVK